MIVGKEVNDPPHEKPMDVGLKARLNKLDGRKQT